MRAACCLSFVLFMSTNYFFTHLTSGAVQQNAVDTLWNKEKIVCRAAIYEACITLIAAASE